MRTIMMLNYEDESAFFLGSFFDVLMLVMRTIGMSNYEDESNFPGSFFGFLQIFGAG